MKRIIAVNSNCYHGYSIEEAIAGIQAALDLADHNIHVHLIEREPTIGGTPAFARANASCGSWKSPVTCSRPAHPISCRLSRARGFYEVSGRTINR